MDKLFDKSFHRSDDIIAELFLEDSGLDLDFDFRNDGTVFPIKDTSPPYIRRKRSRFSPLTGTYSRQSSQLTVARLQGQNQHDKIEHNDSFQDLIGDGSRPCVLPTVFDTRHDLKCISPETLSDVIRGTYSLGSYAVVDCRYPYEFQGGHIQNAINIHQTTDVEKFLTSQNKPDILIFHCEFSIERGPATCRHLRQKDRDANADNYPYLSYPEVYLLQGGYKDFYGSYSELCTAGYTPMLDKNYSDDLRHFRQKSKTWCPGQTKSKKGLRLFD